MIYHDAVVSFSIKLLRVSLRSNLTSEKNFWTRFRRDLFFRSDSSFCRSIGSFFLDWHWSNNNKERAKERKRCFGAPNVDGLNDDDDDNDDDDVGWSERNMWPHWKKNPDKSFRDLYETEIAIALLFFCSISFFVFKQHSQLFSSIRF